MPRNTSPAWITRFVTFVVALLVMTTTAWAQDYTVTKSNFLLESKPSNATKLPLTTSTVNNLAPVTLPFEFGYYGRAYTQLEVGVSGFVLPGAGHVVINSQHNYANHGQDLVTDAFPYSTAGRVDSGGGAADMDGIIAPLWTDQIATGTDATYGAVYTWTVGSAPSRKVIVAWHDVVLDPSVSERVTVQLHIHEGTSRIVFAYSRTATNAGFASEKYVCGLDAPSESRFTVPLSNTNKLQGHPGNDFIFDPRTVSYTGTITYDKLVADSTGIGNTVVASRPVPAFPVELRRDGGILAASTQTASDGTFSLTVCGAASTSTGDLHLLARGSGCRVHSGGATPATVDWTAASNIAFSSGGSLGALRLTSTTDAAASIRSAVNIVETLELARAWAAARTSTSLPFLDVLLDETLVSGSTYQSGVGTSPALLVVAGKSSSNPDAWDDDVLTKLYARHVLATITAPQPGAYDDRFDANVGAQNAFAEAFGYACRALMAGKTTFVDATGASTAVVRNLETPTITVPRSDTVSGAVTAALFDLTDAANETHDTIDGTAEPDAFFRIVDAMTTAPTAATFLQAWADAGQDGFAITRSHIGNGILGDDAAEPNDVASEAQSLGDIGLRRTGFLLNRYSEDWYRVSLPDPVTSLTVDATWQRSSTNASIRLEILNAVGAVIVTGAAQGTTGPIRATTGALASGSYLVRVRHESGAMIPTYEIQAFKPLTISSSPFRNWTVGQGYDIPLGVDGGVPPYTFTPGAGGLPPGIGVSTANNHGTGTPTTAGSYGVQLTVKDSGTPQNTAIASQNVVIAPPVDVALAPFVGFPLGLAIDTTLPVTGGTPPLDLDLVGGMLPDGLSIDGAFRVTGTASIAGATPFELEATDVASSTESAAVRGVVCPQGLPKNLLVDLAAGDAACGFWIDAVQGSTLRFSAKTKPKAVKRALTVTVLGPDRLAIAGLKVKAPLGGASCASIPCAKSGRYYVILSSASGEATQLITAIGAVPPKSGKVMFDDLAPGTAQNSATFGALAGAKVTIRVTPAKKSPLKAAFTALLGPDGLVHSDGVVVKVAGNGFTVTATLPDSGTWNLLFTAGPLDSEPGDIAVSYTLKQPKSGAFEADE